MSAGLASFVAATGSAQVVTYGDASPTGNYAAFLAGLAGLGATPNTITFDSQSPGALNPTFFPGVTFSSVTSFNTIRNDAGPADGNNGSTPLSSGEGPHASSPYILGESPNYVGSSSLTVSFANPTAGAGLFIVDLFNPFGSQNFTLEAFTGQNGTGSSLGSFNVVAYNFQNNNSYFVGFTSAADDIQSLVVSRISDGTGDTIGIDDVTFAGPVSPTATPEPASVALMATGLVGVAAGVRRRRKA